MDFGGKSRHISMDQWTLINIGALAQRAAKEMNDNFHITIVDGDWEPLRFNFNGNHVSFAVKQADHGWSFTIGRAFCSSADAMFDHWRNELLPTMINELEQETDDKVERLKALRQIKNK